MTCNIIATCCSQGKTSRGYDASTCFCAFKKSLVKGTLTSSDRSSSARNNCSNIVATGANENYLSRLCSLSA